MAMLNNQMLSKKNTLSWHHNVRFMASSPRFPRRWSLPALQLQLGWSLFFSWDNLWLCKKDWLIMDGNGEKNRDYLIFWKSSAIRQSLINWLVILNYSFQQLVFLLIIWRCARTTWRYWPNKICGESISKNGDVLPTHMRSLYNRIYTSIITYIYIWYIYI